MNSSMGGGKRKWIVPPEGSPEVPEAVKAPSVYEMLDRDELQRDHARLTLVRMRLNRCCGLMDDSMAHSMAGREILKCRAEIERSLSLMQAQIRRLDVPEG